MSRSRKCLIYSSEGFDVDVLINVLILYRRIGFEVRFGKFPEICDLLVVLRGDMLLPWPTDMKMPRAVHIYTYVGKAVGAALCTHLKNVPTLVVSPSQDIVDRRVPSDSSVIIALPPVYPVAWLKRLRSNPPHRVVHIGNFKEEAFQSGDLPMTEFVRFLERNEVLVWGRNWERHLPGRLQMGKAELPSVSMIYASSGLGVGVMYPFQRGFTISGRFWHGPLNGCQITVERGALIDRVPGVVEVDYDEPLDFNLVAASLDARLSLREASAAYWEKATLSLEDTLEAWLLDRVKPVAPTSRVSISTMRNDLWRLKYYFGSAAYRSTIPWGVRNVGEPR